MNNAIQLSIATRVYTRLVQPPRAYTPKPPPIYATRSGERLLILDTETRDEPAQRLLFGSFQVRDKRRLVKRGLIVGDSCTEAERRILEEFGAKHDIELYSRDEFAELFLAEVFEIGTVCICYNSPFDLSRVAFQWRRGIGKYRDSFTFLLSRNKFRPTLRITSINSREAFIRLVPSLRFSDGRQFRSGRFVDGHTFVGTLTDKNLSLVEACKLYKVRTPKRLVEQHGVLTPEYIEYNLVDVQATYEVYCAALRDFLKLRLPVTPDKVYSTASIGKAYFKKMGVKSLAARQPDFPPEIHGYAMESYNGARVECHVRKTIEDVSYLDVLSMYPTVFVLQKLWWLIVADSLRMRECTPQVEELLGTVTVDRLFDKGIWPELPRLVLLEPSDDLLPVRAEYQAAGGWNIGLNHFSGQPTWYTLADAINSVLKTKKVPRILRAITLNFCGIQNGLRPIKLFGRDFDPRADDFFKVLIEHRRFLQNKSNGSELDELSAQALKIVANSTAYGQNGEFNETVFTKPVAIEIFGADTRTILQEWYEDPGRYSNPYIATCVTGAARLMLTMMELTAADLGATYASCDTDSMTIIDPEGTVTPALVQRFEALNPYSFGGSILKIEDENYAR